MRNIMILSAGRRTKLVEYFVSTFAGEGRVIATDCSKFAPALYYADKHYIVPRISELDYIDTILDICQKEDVKAIFSLIDPELSIIAKNSEKFKSIGVMPIVSDYQVCETCLDKYSMYEFCVNNGYLCTKTYLNIEEFIAATEADEVDFPVFIKPRYGSASLGINKITNMDELEFMFKLQPDLLIQEFLKGQECGIDVYVDMLSGQVTSIFSKNKLLMRAGETDKSVSFKNKKLFVLVQDFIEKLRVRGPCDIDIFKNENKYYILEVNPRFGGGYLHAYESGCDFPKYIFDNICGIPNKNTIGLYKEGITLMKCDHVVILDGLENHKI